MTTKRTMPPNCCKELFSTSTSMDDYFPGAPPLPSRWAPCEERTGKGDGLNRKQILMGFFPFPIQSSQSQIKLWVTPLFLFHSFCHLHTSSYNTMLELRNVKSIVTVVSSDNFQVQSHLYLIITLVFIALIVSAMPL